MFEIIDGRKELWQWDKNRQLIVKDDSINEVHFCNNTSEVALVCEVFEQDGLRLVNVPNILLQEDWNINVYAYCGYTKIEKTFKVNRRSKPADYVYTETEIKDYEDLKARVDEIEKNGISQAAQIEQNKADIAEIKSAGYITSMPSEYVTESELTAYGYQTEAQVNALINSALGVIENGSY